MSWYLLKVQPFREIEIKVALIRTLDDFVGQIVVPTAATGPRGKLRALFQGYVFIDIPAGHESLSPTLWLTSLQYALQSCGVSVSLATLRHVDPVTKHVTSCKEPFLAWLNKQAISDFEAQKMGLVAKPKVKLAFKKGQDVTVTSGPFIGMSGVVETVTADSVTVSGQMFGRIISVSFGLEVIK